MPRSSVRILHCVIISLILGATFGCGWGLSRTNNGGSVSISISPGSPTVSSGGTQQFQATVTGSDNTSVQWQVNQVAGGSPQTGTISTAGLYTAPSTTTSMTVTVTAVAAADTSKSANASVTIAPSTSGVAITISPTSATVNTGATQQFTAAVTGSTNTAVTWAVDSVAGGNATSGTVDANGLYTAPATAGNHMVTATSVADTTQSATANVTVGSGNTAGLKAINHIIFITQENRSFDSYLGKLNEYRSKQGLPTDVDGLPDDCSSGNSDWTVACGAMNKSPDANGVPTTPIYAFRLKTMCIENTSPDWIISHWAFNAEDPNSNTPMMDGFVIGAASAALSTGVSDTKGIRAMGFYNGDDLAYPYWLASQFATSDRWFSPAPTKTEPNRYFMVAATSGGRAYPNKSTINAKTIFDLLQAGNVSWKIYSQNGSTSAAAFSGFMTKYSDHIVPLSQFAADAQSGNLPQVSYVEKPDADEHPGVGVNLQYGVQQVRDLVNAVMYDANGGPGPSWKDSVVIVTFDESGALYDHVPPPTNVPSPDGIKPIDTCTSSSDPNCATASLTHQAPPYDPVGDFTRYGFRVPLMVISPFTKPHYVSHTTTDYTSWMKLVETRFGLPSLNARDAAGIDMTEFFDFTGIPWATPPANPPGVNIGQCYDSLP